MADTDINAVGDRIREEREKRGWRQRELAEAIGVSTQAINRYETGVRNVYADKLMDIARALGIPVGKLFPNGDGLSEEEREIVNQMRANPSHRVVIKSTLRGLNQINQSEYEAE